MNISVYLNSSRLKSWDCYVTQYVINSQEILVNAAELKCGLRNKRAREY